MAFWVNVECAWSSGLSVAVEADRAIAGCQRVYWCGDKAIYSPPIMR